MVTRILLVALLCLATTSCASLMGKSKYQRNMDRRVAALEAKTSHLNTLENRVDNLSSLSENSGQIQSELRDFRGQIQDLKHQLTVLSDQQRQQYLDLDHRLQTLSSGGQRGQRTNRQVNPAEKKAYLNAFKLLEYGKYKKAISAFQKFLKDYPNGSYADNAHYWLAETYYVQQDMKTSMSEFQALIKNYPNSPKVPGSLLKIGTIYSEQGKQDQAREYLNKVKKNYPNTTAAAQAGKRLANMK